MKLAVISLESNSSKLIAEAAKKYFDKVDSLNLKRIELHVDSKSIDIFYNDKKLGDYDCIYLRGSHKYAILMRSITTALSHKCYMPICPASFTIGHDKFLTLLNLQKHNVPIPKTYIAATTKLAKKILEKVHYPVILKTPAGTHGKGVMFADSVSSANTLLDALETFKQPYIIQEYVESGASDTRAIVVNEKVVAAMKRKAVKNELRANIHMGGTGKKVILDYDTAQIAIKSAKAVGADICGVDLLEGVKIQVVEVNLSPGIQGITEATKINVADEVAKGLYDGTKEFLSKKKGEEYSKVLDGLKKEDKEILMNLDIKAGRIRLPDNITNITKFRPEDEVIIVAEKGKVVIKKAK